MGKSGAREASGEKSSWQEDLFLVPSPRESWWLGPVPGKYHQGCVCVCVCSSMPQMLQGVSES